MGNLQVLEALFEKWFDNEDENPGPAMCPSTYIRTKKTDVNQKIFFIAEDSFRRCIQVSEWHARQCRHNLCTNRLIQKGHVVKTNLKCGNQETPHVFSWSSSPYLPTKEYLINSRVNHGIVCSGILPSDYKRFVSGSGIGMLNEENRTSFFNKHQQHIQEEYNECIDTALLEEIASYEDLDSIDIMSDARNGWRKNAKDTSVVAIGEKTHKVLKCEHVTKAHDIVSQRHEKVGTVRIYQYMKDKDVRVGVHCHDRNLSINKYIREETETLNQNDTWHCVNAKKTAVKKISSGPQYSKGKTWSFQLSDKVEPVATHVHWCIRNCNQQKEMLKSTLLNIVDHYKNIHTGCSESSRCRKDTNYEPSRIVISDPVAEKLLVNAILGSNIYKYANDYTLGRDTFYVESFNNVINIYQNKRISFGDLQYNARNNLAVCHWNENVDREYTSVSHLNDHRRPRCKKGKKNYKKAMYKFKDKIWSRYINNIYKKKKQNKRKGNNN
ncbi:unnamed protein product [Mytilus coruscus]|uniref:Uncharacterized protein n=1 Tax=Mytilus coruscus TaxID=42192 RepID=A0A6J8B7J0_MYTCO|nr:unnamed protein product [Mytilus coruscus]